jgi:hypothetical protein
MPSCAPSARTAIRTRARARDASLTTRGRFRESGIGSGTDREGASGDRETTRRERGTAVRKTHQRPRRWRALGSARENARGDTAWLIACGGQWLRKEALSRSRSMKEGGVRTLVNL